MGDREAVLEALRGTFGLQHFRPCQEEAILAALAGRDVLAVLPTGGGKSLIYSLPPVASRSLAVVVSPLIALMEDQVRALTSLGVAAAFLSSTIPEPERQRLLSALCCAGQPGAEPLRVLLVTPETACGDAFLDAAAAAARAGALRLLAVDEAHCVSSWGHDFRPKYRRMALLRRRLPGVPMVALTATASPRVRADIAQSLCLESPLQLVASFDRPNIHYSVRYPELQGSPGADADARLGGPEDGLPPPPDPLPDLISLLRGEGQPGRGGGGGRASPPCAIVYCHTREGVGAAAQRLAAAGVACAAYHAGLPAAQRSAVLAAWSSGRLPVVAATVAFGMGIDRPDVRLVAHLNMPASMDSLYQESGRAGRDGLPSRSVVYCSTADRHRMQYLLGKRHQEQQQRRADQGRGSGHRAPTAHRPEVADRATEAFSKVVAWATAPRCRRIALLAHFGEELAPGGAAAARCCDACDSPAAAARAAVALAAAGAQRQQRFAGGGHTLDFSARGRRVAHSQMEFETSRPSEGLEFDEQHPGAWEEAADDEYASEDGRGSPEGEGARAAAKRARRGGGGDLAVFAALEWAERAEQGGRGDGSRQRLQQKLEAGGGGGAPAAANSVTPAMVASLAGRLQAAIASSPALAPHVQGCRAPADQGGAGGTQADQGGAGGTQADQGGAGGTQADQGGAVGTQADQGGADGTQAAAATAAAGAALAAGVRAASSSKAVFMSLASNLLLGLRRAQSLAEAPALQAWVDQHLSPCSWPAEPGASAGCGAALAGTAEAAGSHAAGSQPISEAPGAAGAEQPEGGRLERLVGEAERLSRGQRPQDWLRAAQVLASLARLPVSAAVLQRTLAGRRVKALGRHADACVAAAARDAVAAWKASLVDQLG